MSLLDDLAHDDDSRRLDAADRAGRDGEASLAPKLLELALTDPADVRVIGGVAEMYRTVSSAAAGALAQLFRRHGADEALVRAAARDLGHDDAAVGQLLYYLGELASSLRAELERDPEPRLRLRALLSVLSTQRTVEQTRRALEDPSPLVRTEALTATMAWSEYPRALLDPTPEVRLKAAHELRAGTRHTDDVLAALEREPDPAVRAALVQCLPMRWRDGQKVLDALTRALDEPDAVSRRVAAHALRKVDRPAVGRAIVARCTTETDPLALYELLSYAHLPRYGRDLVPFLAEVLEKTARPELRSAALHALAGYGVPAVEPLLPLTTHADAEVRKAALFALGAVGGAFTLARVKEVRAKASPPHARALDALVTQLEAALAKKGVPVAAPELEPDRDATPSRVGTARAVSPEGGVPRLEPAGGAGPNPIHAAERPRPQREPAGAAAQATPVAGANAMDPQRASDGATAQATPVAGANAMDPQRASDGATAQATPVAGANAMDPQRASDGDAAQATPVAGANAMDPQRASDGDAGLVEAHGALALHSAGGSPHTIHVGPDTLPIRPGQTVAIPPDVAPSALTVHLVCAGCGARARATAPITFAYLDDDHFGYQELGYVATRWTNCPRCATTWLFEARFTRTNVRGTTEWTYAWDSGTQSRGAALVTAPAQ